ncbi:MAG: 1-phosphofructokinase [Mobilitalea sp.]
MIYTVTLNPSLDYIVQLQDFQIGSLNLAKEEHIVPGGKGINVSLVLKNLGIESTALGFIAGFSGVELERNLQERGIATNFVTAGAGLTRINVKIKAKEESEINAQGPMINRKELYAMLDTLELLQDGDVLVLAGSIPKMLPNTIYRTILEKLQGRKIKIVVDATKELLRHVLLYKPFLIKPNQQELSEIAGKELYYMEDILEQAKKLSRLGAQNVLVSMAGEGAVLLTDQGDTMYSKAPKGALVNSVGAGDSMVAGFIAGYLTTNDYKEAFKMGVSAGSASAFSKELATKEQIDRIYRSVWVE